MGRAMVLVLVLLRRATNTPARYDTTRHNDATTQPWFGNRVADVIFARGFGRTFRLYKTRVVIKIPILHFSSST